MAHTNKGGERRPDFRQLDAFLKVAESRSFAETGRRLGISQPAVSQTIARLEEILGGDVFERRRGAPILLTPIGRAILPSARLLLFTIDHQFNRAIQTAQGLTGSLAIGHNVGVATGPLSDGIVAFGKYSPGVRVRMTEGSPSELYRRLNERSLAIIFTAYLGQISGIDGPPVSHPGLMRASGQHPPGLTPADAAYSAGVSQPRAV